MCPSEAAALERESKLLRSIKPRYNRSGVWPGKARYIIWRLKDQQLELGVADTPEPDGRRFGPRNSSAHGVYHSLARLLWLATHCRSSVVEMPAGWAQGRVPEKVTLVCGTQSGDILAGLENFFWQSPESLWAWLGSQFFGRSHPFERAAIESDMETLHNFSQKRDDQRQGQDQFALL